MLSFGSTMQVISVLPKFRASAICQNLNFCFHRRTSIHGTVLGYTALPTKLHASTYDYDIQVHKGDIICLRCSKVGFGSHNGAKVW